MVFHQVPAEILNKPEGWETIKIKAGRSPQERPAFFLFL